ncbi:MAG: hypothetical protein CMC99_05530 [Flavobacteriales bacterium]|nr:hypothetical protein [Flavobacteriales bacterium]
MHVAALLLWGPWCWTCWTCAGAPDWPAQGEAHARWVRQAIEWRMNIGLNDCTDIVPALDAWTLEWLSESDQIHVEVNTADWPFLAYVPELQSVLIQRLAYDQLSFQTSTQADIVRDVRFVAKRSEGLWDDALKRAFDNAEGLAKRRDSAR